MSEIEFELENFPFYYMFESVTFDEDYHHEFKGHRSICVEELPANCLRPNITKQVENQISFLSRNGRSRQCVSKAINAFLNTGDGGCVYLGITDDGIVRGMQLTDFQRDHTELNIHDLMSRYNPPVPSDRYRIKFVPVIKRGSNLKAYLENLENKRLMNSYENEFDARPHLMRSCEMCWCDYDCEVRMAHNKIIPPFVVEIHVEKYTVPPVSLENITYDYMKYFYPIFETEENNCHFRREASVNNYTKQEIYSISVVETEIFCAEITNKLLREKKQLQEEIKKKRKFNDLSIYSRTN